MLSSSSRDFTDGLLRMIWIKGRLEWQWLGGSPDKLIVMALGIGGGAIMERVHLQPHYKALLSILAQPSPPPWNCCPIYPACSSILASTKNDHIRATTNICLECSATKNQSTINLVPAWACPTKREGEGAHLRPIGFERVFWADGVLDWERNVWEAKAEQVELGGSCRFGADNPPLRLILFERVIPSHLIISIAPQTAF